MYVRSDMPVRTLGADSRCGLSVRLFFANQTIRYVGNELSRHRGLTACAAIYLGALVLKPEEDSRSISTEQCEVRERKK